MFQNLTPCLLTSRAAQINCEPLLLPEDSFIAGYNLTIPNTKYISVSINSSLTWTSIGRNNLTSARYQWTIHKILVKERPPRLSTKEISYKFAILITSSNLNRLLSFIVNSQPITKHLQTFQFITNVTFCRELVIPSTRYLSKLFVIKIWFNYTAETHLVS